MLPGQSVGGLGNRTQGGVPVGSNLSLGCSLFIPVEFIGLLEPSPCQGARDFLRASGATLWDTGPQALSAEEELRTITASSLGPWSQRTFGWFS